MEVTGSNYTRGDWRSFVATKRGTVLVAGVCALIAGAIIVIAMQHYRHSIDSEGVQQTVLVASQPIQKGTAGSAIASEQLFKATSVAGKQVTAGALADTAQLRGKVAAREIYAGEQLTAADFAPVGGL